MRTHSALFVALALTATVAVESGAQEITPSDTPSAAALRRTAREIGECQPAMLSEKKWGKRPQEIERWYVGHPVNVVWNIEPSATPARSAQSAFMEFSVSRYRWIPPETKDKFEREHKPSMAEVLLYTSQVGEWKLRYEFDVVTNGGVELVRSLVRKTTLK